MIRVTASIETRPGKEEDLIAALTQAAALTRQEEGCVEYDLHRSLTAPQRFTMIETWKSQEALDRHLQAPHTQELFARAESIVAAPVDIQTWSKVEL